MCTAKRAAKRRRELRAGRRTACFLGSALVLLPIIGSGEMEIHPIQGKLCGQNITKELGGHEPVHPYLYLKVFLHWGRSGLKDN